MVNRKPRLIKPITVCIEQIDKTKTPYSGGPRGTRDVRNNVIRKTKVTLKAQVVFGDRDQKARYVQLGKGEEIKGYLLFLTKDLKKKNIDLEFGDKITKMGKTDVELFISHSTGDLTAQFSDTNDFEVVRMFFHDREAKGG